jgi:hypothetical protein
MPTAVNLPLTQSPFRGASRTYDVDSLVRGAIAGDIPLSIPNLRVAASELYLKQGIHALIGRDVLKRCILVYNGGLNQFSLCF